MTHTLYFIPGVATDPRVFERLEIPGHEKVFLRWQKPLPGETMPQYAERLARKIDPSTNPVLVGYSFGGMMAIELAKFVPHAAVIIISSIKHYHERPVAMALTSGLSLNQFFPARLGKNFRFAYAWLNDPQGPQEEEFIDTMAADMDPEHTDWAIHHALSWRHDRHTPRLWHIHGTEDRIFPIRYIRNCIAVRGGSHLMLLNKAPEISAHILRILGTLESRDRHAIHDSADGLPLSPAITA